MAELSNITLGAQVALTNGREGMFIGWGELQDKLWISFGIGPRGPVTMPITPERIRSYANVERFCEAVVLP